MSAQHEDIFTTWTDDLTDVDASVVCLCGELDASSTPDFVAEARGVIDRGRHVIMDANLLSYIDSTGVAAIVSTKNALKSHGKRMYLVGCHGLLTKLLQITRLESEMLCFANVESALADLKTVGSTEGETANG